MDLSLIQWLNRMARQRPALAFAMDIVARFGHWIFIFYGLWLWFGGKNNRVFRREASLMALASVVVCSLLSFFVGKLFFRPRPFTKDSSIWNFTEHKANASFPSNHTMNAAVVSLVLLRCGLPGAFWLLSLTVLLAVSRMVAGIHYLTDIVGAFVMAGLVHISLYRSHTVRLAASLLAWLSLPIESLVRRKIERRRR